MSSEIEDMLPALQRSFERRMESLLMITGSTGTTWLVILALSGLWHWSIQRSVPLPYLDEFFHVQQAELYLQGRFTEWHPKITTPPGLYAVSLAYLFIFSIAGISDYVYVSDLRRTNLWPTIVLPFIIRSIINKNLSNHDGLEADAKPTPYLWSRVELNHAVFNMCIFPPMFFFYCLYYTDVWSATSVLITFWLHQKEWRKSMVAAGIFSLFFRQTNIFWVAIFLGGLEVIRKLERGRPGLEFRVNPTVLDVVTGSWQHSRLYDPLISQALIEDYFKTMLSLVTVAITQLPQLVKCLKPYLIILGAFLYFVLWNDGVVLGDKENHIASIHLAQMLYIWPYIMFFSFPLLYPYILNTIVSPQFLPTSTRSFPRIYPRFRLNIAITICSFMGLIVHHNTIVHPFTLADNRHYTFYVFRLLLRSHPLTRHLVIPIYYLSAYAAITALGGLPNVQTPNQTTTPPPRRIWKKSRLPQRLQPGLANDRGNRVSLALIWLLATSLSVTTAPLVEPRYFIVPWLIWRIHVVYPRPTGDDRTKRLGEGSQGLWFETFWFLFVNWAVGYMFLFKGFEWPHERGKVQRFMW
ncbi:MAG: hypothetical protein Q9218_007897 [Villophora microphyllina]